jgi:starch-binding outer membrane protein, SusD/RagB family
MFTPIIAGVRHRGAHRWMKVSAATLIAGVAIVGCSTFLDVDNPNNVPEDALENETAATAIANGAGGSVTRALAGMLAPYSTLTDELTWVGSRDAYKELDDGTPSNPSNEFTDAAFAYISEARFTNDQAVALLEGFDAENKLASRADLARTYLYAAIIYVSIADMFDDFVVSSNKREAGDPVGEANMGTMYDKAIAYLDKGLVVATAINNIALRQQITAMRARAKFDKALWAKVNPVGTAAPAQPLVNDAGAAADAQAALVLIGAGNDFKFKLTPLAQTTGAPIVGNDLNNRVELRAGDGPLQVRCTNATCDRYIVPNSAGKQVASVKYQDPVNNIVDPVLTAAITECCIKGTQNGNGDLVPMTIVSAREMYLILAEVALAQGNTAGFTTNINAIRAFNQGLQPYAGTPAARDMLIHERLVNLWLQGRRLTDMYRFGIKSQEWAPTSIAATTMGCFLPITVTERLSNANVQPQTTCAPR